MKKRLLFLIIIFLFVLGLLINKMFVKYVYVNPQTNTKVLKYITKIIKPVEMNFETIMKLCQKEHKDMKYAYKNYYGSGFLKENTIPNDLDISVGIDLGLYEYDGTNEQKIAEDIEDKIALYHIYSYSVFEESKKRFFVLDKAAINEAIYIQNKSKETVNNISNGIKNVMADKEQIIHFNKKYKENDVDYTFILNQNEILVNEIQPLFAFTNGVFYNSQMLDYPREISILPDFYVKIKDKKTGKIKDVELIEESFLGERFQISRRFFVPVVFTGNNSLKYIKTLDYLNDDEKYFEMRMFNYFRYLNEVNVYFDFTVDPVKLVKRMHQCTDIIEPALSEEEKNKIYSDIRTVMNNSDIQATNEYKNIIKNFQMITSGQNMYRNAQKVGYNISLIKSSNYVLGNLSENKNYKDEIKEIQKFQQKWLALFMNLGKRNEKLTELYDFLDNNYINVSIPLTKIVNKNIKNTQEYFEDYKILENISKNAGYKKIDIYQKDLNTIYILKNDFTKNLSTEDLKQLAKENNMPQNIEYKLIDKKSLQKGSRSEFRYIRFKTTKAEDENYKKLKENILKDKANFKIKRKYVF